MWSPQSEVGDGRGVKRKKKEKEKVPKILLLQYVLSVLSKTISLFINAFILAVILGGFITI